MNRRDFLKGAVAVPLSTSATPRDPTSVPDSIISLKRLLEEGLEIIRYGYAMRMREYPLEPYEYVGTMLDTRENREIGRAHV